MNPPFWATQDLVSKDLKLELKIGDCHKYECKVCPLNRADVTSPKMAPTGAGRPSVYVLGEAPGGLEDRRGRQFVGPSGEILRGNFPSGYESSVRFNNCIRTRPPDNRNPDRTEIECCRPSVVRDIEQTQPKVIIAVGAVALNWLTEENSITQWRGRLIPVKVGSHRCYAFPVMHPSYLLRLRKTTKKGKPIKSHFEYTFERDIDWVFRNVDILGTPDIPEPADLLANVEYVDGSKSGDLKTILCWLDEATKSDIVGVDIETSSLRPFSDEARILTFGIGYGSKGYSFPYKHPKAEWSKADFNTLHAAIRSFLLSNKTSRVVQNLAFEQEWFCYTFGKEVARAGTWHDTMAQAYVNEYRKDTLSLDSICLRVLGLKLKAISNVDTKNIIKEPLHKVLKYNALDTILLPKLYLSQMVELQQKDQWGVYLEQIRRTPTVVLTQLKGLDVDQSAVKQFSVKLEKDLERINKELYDHEAVISFQDQEGRRFNPNSTKDCPILFRDVLGLREGFREDNKYSTDEDALEAMNHPLADLLIEYRQADTTKSKYVDSHLAEAKKYVYSDGKIHPVFNTMFVDTRRLSSDSPNAQNYPKRRFREVRSQIIPPPGHSFVAIDYGQIEARVIAMFSKDRVLCKALWERYDIHTDWAEQIAHAYPEIVGGRKFINDKDAMKKLRDQTKNKFVFPAFFGSIAYSISRNFGIPLDIVERLLDKFWREFHDVRKWHDDVEVQYQNYGFVETLTGFRRYEPLAMTKIINTPVQGTASDIVIDSMNRLSEEAERSNRWQYQPVLNVHDDLSFCLPDETLEEDLEFCIKQMVGCKFDFINVPLTVEVELGPNWHELEPVGTFSSDEVFK